MAGVPSAPFRGGSHGVTKDDSISVTDTVPMDTLPLDTMSRDKAAMDALPKDTLPAMDSLHLAIYNHNKAIDDSLALDSINKTKKSGIDSPVEFSANDSMVYIAGSGMAHLYGDSHVKYQNMDLKSEKIYMCLDSSLVHATVGTVKTAPMEERMRFGL